MFKSGSKSIFQVIILFVFIAAGIGAVLLFGLGKSSSSAGGTVTVWGSMDPASFQPVIAANAAKDKSTQINYKQVSDDQMGAQLLEAIASGKSPDVVILPEAYLWSFKDKITPIPYASFSQRTFLNTFVQGSEFLMQQNGVEGYPWTVDPLVLFWNRDAFNRAGIATPPKTWSDVATDIPLLLEKTPDNSIVESPIALGTFSNVDHAKDILSMLLMQSGVTITSYDSSTGTLNSVLSSGDTHTENQAAQFYESFADPSSSAYSWNTSLPSSETMFESNNLAMYVGYASEVATIRAENPNLNFDIAEVPQLASSKTALTYGNFYSLVLPRGSGNVAGAYEVMSTMLDPTVQQQIQTLTLFPSVRRDALANTIAATDPYTALIDNAALIANTWIDPAPSTTTGIFSDMINSIHQNTATPAQAINTAQTLLQQAITANS